MIKIKEQFKTRYVGFKGSNGKKLGELNQEQLKTLASIAQTSKDKSLLGLFDNELPSAETLKKEDTASKIAAIPKSKPEKPA